jgi:CubicO group peptidase (beta-lactamase class C family)
MAKAEPPPDAALQGAIDEIIKKRSINDQEPGVAILIIQPGRWIFQKGYGLANLHDQTPIGPRTLFELASVTKTFTATAVLILQERGELSIHDEVRKLLPELPEYSKGRPIRVSDMLQHISGLPDYEDFENVPVRHAGYRANADFLPEFARQRAKFPLRFAPGQKHEYNNSNFMLLALLVERVSRKTFGQFLREEIFEPAGMKNTFVYEDPATVPTQYAPGCKTATGYSRSGRKEPWQATWGTPPARREDLLTVGDGGIWSNLEDMAEWDSAIRTGKLLQPESMQLALTAPKTRDGASSGYGLGWELYFDPSGAMNGFGHGGLWGGFRTSYYRYLRADRTTVILSNRGTFDPDALWYALDAAVERHGK